MILYHSCCLELAIRRQMTTLCLNKNLSFKYTSSSSSRHGCFSLLSHTHTQNHPRILLRPFVTQYCNFFLMYNNNDSNGDIQYRSQKDKKVQNIPLFLYRLERRRISSCLMPLVVASDMVCFRMKIQSKHLKYFVIYENGYRNGSFVLYHLS